MKSTLIKPPLMDRIRLAVGMCWRRERPGLREIKRPVQTAALAVGLIAVYGLVGRLDYEIERAAELEVRAESLADRAAIASDMTERYRIARADAEHYEDYVLACIRGDREWVLGGKRWECQAKPVGPYVAKEE